MGSLCLQSLGLGSVAQVVTGQGAFGQYLSINLGFGLAVAMGSHVGGKISGMKDDDIISSHIVQQSYFALLICFRGSYEWSCIIRNVCVSPPPVEDATSLYFGTAIGVISCSRDNLCCLLW